MSDARRDMDRKDKAALKVIGIVLAVLSLLVLFGVRWVAGLIGVGSEGVGWQTAFVSALIVSTVLVVVFAIASGDGLIGEMPTVVAAFFLFTAFFTVSIALIL